MKIRYLFFVITLMVCMVSCDKNRLDRDRTETIPLTRSEHQYAEKSNDFASELLQMYYDKKKEAYDFVLSPVNLQMFLGMLGAAASEDQVTDINRMLGYESASPEAINSFCKKVLEKSPRLDPKVTLGMVNQWWLNSEVGFRLYPAFAGVLKESYQVEPETRDFSTDPMREITRSWVKEHTRGMIDYGCPLPYPRQCILASAAYFKADWKDQFDRSASVKADFFREDGRTTQVSYMINEFTDVEMYEDAMLQALYLPFGSGAFRMEFYLPRPEKKVQDVISVLREESFPRQGECARTVVNLPVFDLLCSNESLVEDLRDHFGIVVSDRFRSAARYPLCGEDLDGVGMEINEITHMARIRVHEEGAEAAAVTVNRYALTMPAPGTLPRFFAATRPFVFLIREVGSGIVFFSGVYAGGVQ